VKALIQSHYQQGCDGFLIVGSAPYIPDAYWRYHQHATYQDPTDLYYADMDPWIDLGDDGIFETYHSRRVNQQWVEDRSRPANPANHPFSPELIFGRLTAGPLAASLTQEAELIVFNWTSSTTTA
jgi:hypothetical protein